MQSAIHVAGLIVGKAPHPDLAYERVAYALVPSIRGSVSELLIICPSLVCFCKMIYMGLIGGVEIPRKIVEAFGFWLSPFEDVI